MMLNSLVICKDNLINYCIYLTNMYMYKKINYFNLQIGIKFICGTALPFVYVLNVLKNKNVLFEHFVKAR